MDGSPNPSPTTLAGSALTTPKKKFLMHSFLEREWYAVTTPNIISGRGVILFPFGATPPLIGEAEEVVAAEPLHGGL